MTNAKPASAAKTPAPPAPAKTSTVRDNILGLADLVVELRGKKITEGGAINLIRTYLEVEVNNKSLQLQAMQMGQFPGVKLQEPPASDAGTPTTEATDDSPVQ